MLRELRRSTSTLKRSGSPGSEDQATFAMNKLSKITSGDIHNGRQSRRITATSSDDSAWQGVPPGDERGSSRIQKPSELKVFSAATPLQDRYTPEALFLMLKEYAFSGQLASVGVRGPSWDQTRPSSDESRSSQGYHSLNTNKTGGKQDIWTDEAEFAFLAAELYLPPATSSKVMFMQKPCGRNEIIALIISFALGKYMTRKQVSSHLQVVRQRKRMNLEVKCLFDQSASDRSGGGSSPETGTPKLRGIHPRLFEIIGIHPDSNLSEMPKPNWILLHENGQSHRTSAFQDSNRKLYVERVDHRRLQQPEQHQASLRSRAASQRDLPKITYEPVEIQHGYNTLPTKASLPTLMRQTYPIAHQGIEVDELDSDLEHDEHELEQVSDSTPRASPDPVLRKSVPWLDTSRSTEHISLHLDDITLSLGFKGIKVSRNFPLANLPICGADKAPQYGWQLPLDFHAETPMTKYVHVTLCINLNDLGSTSLTGLTPSALTLDLGLQILAGITAGSGETLRLTTISGFLDMPREKSHCIDLERLNADDSSGSSERKVFRPLQPYKDDTLPHLIKKSRDPATSILPYYWIFQEVLSTGSIIQLLYTFEASQQWSIRASEIVL